VEEEEEEEKEGFHLPAFPDTRIAMEADSVRRGIRNDSRMRARKIAWLTHRIATGV